MAAFAAVATRRPIARLVVALAASVLAVALLYLAGMNVFLRTRLFRDAVSAEGGSLRVEYASAYSSWWGRIHAEGLVIRGRDSNVEWVLAIDHCDFRESFFDLLRRRFHASHVRGTGLTFRVRQRLEAVTPAAAMLPPVPGFLDPPRADVGPQPAALSDADYNLWSIQLDDVVAEHVRELWVDTVRLTGDLRIEGRWFFKPLRWLDVGPATLDLRSVTARYGPETPLALDVHGTAVATIAPVDIQGVGGEVIADHLALDADLRGAVIPEAFVERLVAGPASKALLGAWGIAPAAVHLVADHAVSTVVVEAPEMDLESRAPLRGYLPLPDGLDVEVKRATASVRAEVNLSARSLTSHVGLHAAGMTVRTGDEVRTGTLKLEVETKARTSVVDLSGSTAAFTTGAASPEGKDAKVGQDAEDADAKDGKDADTSGWWLRLRLPEARLSLGEAPNAAPHLRALLSATAKDASPVSAFLAKVTPLPRWLLDAVPTKNLRAEGEIRARPSVFEVRSVKARSDGSTVDFEFEKLAYWKEWALLLEAGQVHAGVRAGDGGTEVVLFNAEPWFRAQTSSFRANASRFH